jgi:alkaline phosphatase D
MIRTLLLGVGCSIFTLLNVFAQREILQSGPMVGYAEMREVAIWIQLKEEGDVRISYREKGSSKPHSSTASYKCTKDKAFTAELIADNVIPGKRYEYEVFINDNKISFSFPLEFQTLSLWQWRNDAPDFSFAMGSCFYINEEEYDRPGKPYGGDYGILNSIYQAKPDFMLWLGDNTYLREADWNSRTGYIHRYTHTRAISELQPLLANTHHYAVWDDHDYGPNDSDKTWKLKNTAKEVHDLFWANPPFEADVDGGITHSFQWADCDFFMLDDRYNKSPNSRPGEVLGKKQVEWLKDVLKESKAAFKFVVVGVMFLSSAQNKENFSKAAISERDNLIKFIQDNNITGVIFLTGDRHFAELSVLKEDGKVPIYDFTSSALTAGPASKQYLDEINDNRVAETAYFQRNFGYIKVVGNKANRTAILSLRNVDGGLIWEKSLSLESFKK